MPYWVNGTCKKKGRYGDAVDDGTRKDDERYDGVQLILEDILGREVFSGFERIVDRPDSHLHE